MSPHSSIYIICRSESTETVKGALATISPPPSRSFGTKIKIFPAIKSQTCGEVENKNGDDKVRPRYLNIQCICFLPAAPLKFEAFPFQRHLANSWSINVSLGAETTRWGKAAGASFTV
jgi:hypothetical protein